MRKKLAYALLGIIVVSLSGCSGGDVHSEGDIKTKEMSEIAKDVAQEVADQTANIVDGQEEHVLMVKNGYPESCPETTYQEAFEKFFSYPTWKYFTGTKEGPDEDGDGRADYTEENIDIVEFTGYCMYQETEVKALIQFTVDKEAGTFTATYLSFNEVPQSTLMLYALLEKAFEVTDDVGTAEMEETKAESQNHSKEFTGDWTDSNSQRCYMSINCDNGIDYTIEIHWAQSSSECYDWFFRGTYDEEKEGISYTGKAVFSVYNNDGSVDETCVYNDGTGVIYIGENGKLYWEDNKENAGADCIFEKSGTNESQTSVTAESDYEWYTKHDCFYSKTGNTKLEVYCQADVTLCANFSVGAETLQYYVDVTPSKIGSSGELVYLDSGFSMTYYPVEQYVYIDTSDGLYEGEYWISGNQVASSEYIFPHSDREYLTDAEVSSLSKEMLGFARNEIIARHGRIFSNPIYKEYFESKSWYEGTMEGEKFDAQYEILLNQVEKANIEFIKQYEEN